MFVQDCIDNSIPFLRPTDSVGYALELMEEFKADTLAVVDGAAFLGSVSEQVLLEMDDTITLNALSAHFQLQHLSEGTHLFDVLKKTTEGPTYFLPVLSIEQEYLGITTPARLLNSIIVQSSLATTGGIIVLELETKDYSLTEISKIVESNGAMILHVMMTTSVNQHFMQVSLKINKNDLKEIQLTFERYRYTVVAVLHQSEYDLQLRERYDSLMKYLEV
jgi:hypothetical protein